MALTGLVLISIIKRKGKIRNSETSTDIEGAQEMRIRCELTEAERVTAQSDENEAVESKSLTWYEKGKAIIPILHFICMYSRYISRRRTIKRTSG